jgi:hypothetical protein
MRAEKVIEDPQRKNNFPHQTTPLSLSTTLCTTLFIVAAKVTRRRWITPGADLIFLRIFQEGSYISPRRRARK